MRDPANFIAVTGASGFVGRALVPALIAAGWRVLSLGRSAPQDPHVEFAQWRLGEPLPAAADGASWVIHLACAALGAGKDARQAADLDLSGTATIAEQLRRLWEVEPDKHRLMFLSSQSAHPRARNQYGQQKWRLEQLLASPGEVIVRPGLIYADDVGASVYAGLARLVRASPILPDVGHGRAIQPIHVQDLAQAIVRILAQPDSRRLWRLGEPDPMPFPALVGEIARANGLRRPLVVPMPIGPFLGVLRHLPLIGEQAERVLGLNALRPMETRESLASLGLRLRPWGGWARTERRRRIREAKALLAALGAAGHGDASPWAVRQLARWIEARGVDRRPLGGLMCAWPAAIRYTEPLGPSRRRAEMNAAMAIYEASPAGQRRRFAEPRSGARVVGGLVGLMALELALLPVRMMASLFRPRQGQG